jgi:hypothetical protein
MIFVLAGTIGEACSLFSQWCLAGGILLSCPPMYDTKVLMDMVYMIVINIGNIW